VLPYASNTLKIHPWHSPHYWAQLFLGGVFPYHAGIFPGNRCGKGQRGNLCYAEIICLIPIFWLLSRLGLGWTWWAFPLSKTISGEFGLVLYLRQIHRWPDV